MLGEAVCGDGVVAGDEVCDDGGESATCDADCTAAACGDGHVNGAAGETCDGGAPVNAACIDCAVVCASPFDDCNGDPDDGCEADLAHDGEHCGQCGFLCNPGLVCEDGLCVP
jgi:hypothetical protein